MISSSVWVCHDKNGHPPPPPNWFHPELIFRKIRTPGTYFTAKNGLPLKILDHLPQMKNIDPEHFSFGFSRVTEVSGNYSGA